MSKYDKNFSVFSKLTSKMNIFKKDKLTREKSTQLNSDTTSELKSPEFSWWAPRNWNAFVITLLITLFIILVSLVVIRFKDKGYDDPFEFEQVYYLNNSLTLPKKSVTIYCNLFGSGTRFDSSLVAEIVQIRSKDSQTSIEALTNNFVNFSPLTLAPGKTRVSIEALPRYAKLKNAFEAMALQKMIDVIPGTGWWGAIYSFELIMVVKRNNEQIRTVYEVFHFRADGWSERVFVILVFLALFVAILFVIELRKLANQFRKRKRRASFFHFLRILLKMASQVVKYLDFPNGEWKFFIPVIKLLFFKVFSVVDPLLEKLEHPPEDAEPLHGEVKENLKQIKMFSGDEYQFDDKTQFVNTITSQRQLITNVMKLLTWREIKALPPADIKHEIDKLNQEIDDVYNQLSTRVRQYNQERTQKKQQHENAKLEVKQRIINGIKNFLNHIDSKNDITKLATTFPLTSNIDPEQIFKIEDVYSKGQFEVIKGELKLIFPFLSFPIPNSECGTEQPIYLEIARVDEEYRISQPTHFEPHQKLGTVLVPARLDEETNITYEIELTEIIHFEQIQDIDINVSQIDLINPQPDPADWFKLAELPPPPEKVKF